MTCRQRAAIEVVGNTVIDWRRPVGGVAEIARRARRDSDGGLRCGAVTASPAQEGVARANWVDQRDGATQVGVAGGITLSRGNGAASQIIGYGIRAGIYVGAETMVDSAAEGEAPEALAPIVPLKVSTLEPLPAT